MLIILGDWRSVFWVRWLCSLQVNTAVLWSWQFYSSHGWQWSKNIMWKIHKIDNSWVWSICHSKRHNEILDCHTQYPGRCVPSLWLVQLHYIYNQLLAPESLRSHLSHQIIYLGIVVSVLKWLNHSTLSLTFLSHHNKMSKVRHSDRKTILFFYYRTQ